MSLTRVEPTSIDSNATFVFANATITTNLLTSNLSANLVTANTINFNGLANLGAVANVKISGGTANHVLLTDGSSNLRWGVPTNAAVANTVANGAQPNITSLGSLTNILISNSSAGATSPVSIQETWNNSSISFTGIGLNVVDTSSGVGSALLTLSVNSISRFSVNKTGNISAANASLGNTASANFLSGTLTTSFQPNITYIGQLALLNVTGNITAGNATVSGSIYGAVQGVIGGQTPNSATFTSVNVNNTVSISGNLVAANANLGNITRANFFVGDGSLLSNVSVGSVGNANYANFSGAVTSSNQPNITSIGNLSNLLSNGTVNFSNSSNVRLPSITNVKMNGGTTGQYLTTDGAGNLSFATISSTSISNGTSNVITSGAGGNVTISSGGNANVVVVTPTGIQINGIATVTGNAIIQGHANFLGNTTFSASRDKCSTIAGASGITVHNMSNGAVFYHTGATANFTPNFTNVETDNNYATVAVLFIVQGATAYMPTASANIQIGGSNVTVKWPNGTIPTETPSGIDMISYSFIRQAGTWTVLGQSTSYL
jgi:hypothetical protein